MIYQKFNYLNTNGSLKATIKSFIMHPNSFQLLLRIVWIFRQKNVSTYLRVHFQRIIIIIIIFV